MEFKRYCEDWIEAFINLITASYHIIIYPFIRFWVIFENQLAPNWYRYLRLKWIVKRTVYSSDYAIQKVIEHFLNKNKLSEKQGETLKKLIFVDANLSTRKAIK